MLEGCRLTAINKNFPFWWGRFVVHCRQLSHMLQHTGVCFRYFVAGLFSACLLHCFKEHKAQIIFFSCSIFIISSSLLFPLSLIETPPTLEPVQASCYMQGTQQPLLAKSERSRESVLKPEYNK